MRISSTGGCHRTGRNGDIIPGCVGGRGTSVPVARLGVHREALIMSRLDRHVAMVQNKLALGRFVGALAWASVIWAAAVWLGIVIDRVFRVRPIGARWWIWGGLAACALAAMVYALVRRPTRHDAAVAID